MSKVYTKKINKNIWITGRRQRLIILYYLYFKLPTLRKSDVNRKENRNFKTNLKQTLITTMVT